MITSLSCTMLRFPTTGGMPTYHCGNQPTFPLHHVLVQAVSPRNWSPRNCFFLFIYQPYCILSKCLYIPKPKLEAGITQFLQIFFTTSIVTHFVVKQTQRQQYSWHICFIWHIDARYTGTVWYIQTPTKTKRQKCKVKVMKNWVTLKSGTTLMIDKLYFK